MMIDANQLRPGVLVASAVVPSDHTTTRVRLCNTNPVDVVLNAETTLSIAQCATVCAQDEHKSQDRSTKVSEIIQELCTQLPSTIDDNTKNKISSLLFKYSNIISVDDYDLQPVRSVTKNHVIVCKRYLQASKHFKNPNARMWIYPIMFRYSS